MAEDLGEVLKEVSGLLRRIADQHENSARRFEESRLRAEEVREKMRDRLAGAEAIMDQSREGRLSLQKSREDMAKRLEASRSVAARQREEDLEFRQRLLA